MQWSILSYLKVHTKHMLVTTADISNHPSSIVKQGTPRNRSVAHQSRKKSTGSSSQHPLQDPEPHNPEYQGNAFSNLQNRQSTNFLV